MCCDNVLAVLNCLQNEPASYSMHIQPILLKRQKGLAKKKKKTLAFNSFYINFVTTMYDIPCQKCRFVGVGTKDECSGQNKMNSPLRHAAELPNIKQ